MKNDAGKDERNEKIVSLYYRGYSRRALGAAYNITTQRVREILERHARANGLDWPPRSMTGGFGTRCDHATRYKPIPPEAL